MSDPTTSPTRAELLDRLSRKGDGDRCNRCYHRRDVHVRSGCRGAVAGRFACLCGTIGFVEPTTIEIPRAWLEVFAAPSPGDALRQQIDALPSPTCPALSGTDRTYFIEGYDHALDVVLALLSRGEAGQ